MQNVYTIGHSTHPLEDFIRLLQQHDVNSVIDVRSSPYSRYNPQFNREPFQAALYEREILYAHFGKEFGARHMRPSLLDADGRVDFDKVRASDDFKRGINRLAHALDMGYRAVLMCSEGDPLDCHRFSMISYQLVREHFQVIHILKDGTTIENSELENRMIEKYRSRLPQTTLFETVTPEERLVAAYRLLGRDVAFKAKSDPEDS